MSEEYSDKPRKENKVGTIAGLTAGGVAVAALCFFAGTQFSGGNITNNHGGARPGEPNQQMSRPDEVNRGDRRGGSDKKDVPNEENNSDKKDIPKNNQDEQGSQRPNEHSENGEPDRSDKNSRGWSRPGRQDNQDNQGGPGGQSESRGQGGPGNSSQAGPDRQNR